MVGLGSYSRVRAELSPQRWNRTDASPYLRRRLALDPPVLNHVSQAARDHEHIPHGLCLARDALACLARAARLAGLALAAHEQPPHLTVY